MALSGPNPLGGPADLLIVAEEPGVGLGAGLAGLPGPDPGDGFARRAPHATVRVANHEAPLWVVESAGKAVFVGEVAASWVWIVLWPDTAGALLVEPLALRDLRDPGQEYDLPFGALCTRLPALFSPLAAGRSRRCSPARRRAPEAGAFPRRSAQTASLLSPGTGAPFGSRVVPIRWRPCASTSTFTATPRTAPTTRPRWSGALARPALTSWR